MFLNTCYDNVPVVNVTPSFSLDRLSSEVLLLHCHRFELIVQRFREFVFGYTQKAVFAYVLTYFEDKKCLNGCLRNL